MATKDELIAQIDKLTVKNVNLTKQNKFLMKQQNELRRIAEDFGSRCAKAEQELIRVKDK